MVGDKGKARQVSMKLMASLAPARPEVEAGVVVKADQQSYFCQTTTVLTIHALPRIDRKYIIIPG